MVVSRRPHPFLRRHVRGLWGFEERPGAVTRRVEGPDASVVVVLSFGNEWRIAGSYEPGTPLGRFTSFVAGFHPTTVVTEHDGWSAGLQVSLAPPAAHALLGTSLDELARRTEPLDAVLAGADLLVERLASLPGWDERLDLLEEWLARRLAGWRPADDGVAYAWARLAETGGRLRTGALADELGWSRGRLAARFRERVGVAPKTAARLLRFERAAALLEREPPPAWVEVALACGYYDQSHLVNEFRAITGSTPSAWARRAA
jgi:AraC-like DNA-binding protein